MDLIFKAYKNHEVCYGYFVRHLAIRILLPIVFIISRWYEFCANDRISPLFFVCAR